MRLAINPQNPNKFSYHCEGVSLLLMHTIVLKPAKARRTDVVIGFTSLGGFLLVKGASRSKPPLLELKGPFQLQRCTCVCASHPKDTCLLIVSVGSLCLRLLPSCPLSPGLPRHHLEAHGHVCTCVYVYIYIHTYIYVLRVRVAVDMEP